MTALLNSGRNHEILRWCFHFGTSKLVFLNFNIYVSIIFKCFLIIKSGCVEGFFVRQFLIGSWFMMFGRWFKRLLIYNSASFGFSKVYMNIYLNWKLYLRHLQVLDQSLPQY